jgi:restriction endonuclease Mrr
MKSKLTSLVSGFRSEGQQRQIDRIRLRYKSEIEALKCRHANEIENLTKKYESDLDRMANSGFETKITMRLDSVIRARQCELEVNALKDELKRIKREYVEYHGEALYIAGLSQLKRIVAEVLERMGYEEISAVEESDDSDFDIRAELPLEHGYRVSTIFQCKLCPRNNQTDVLGISYIRDLIGAMMIYEADEAYLITTARFSPEAHTEIADGFEDRAFLVDGELLNEWRTRHGLAPVLMLNT